MQGDKQLKDIFKENIKNIIDVQFQGKAKRLANEADFDAGYLYKLFKENDPVGKNPTLDIVEKCANAANIEAWRLVAPNLGERLQLNTTITLDQNKLLAALIEIESTQSSESFAAMPTEAKALAIKLAYQLQQ
tara:strand:+ start:11504 stop:11902 length:399 start_codon:yes stop_codon:yes gene_type:complete